MDQIWTTEAAALAGLCRREIAPARLFNDPASDLPTTARGHPSTSHFPRQRPPSPPWVAAPATARSAAATASRRRATRPAASASKGPGGFGGGGAGAGPGGPAHRCGWVASASLFWESSFPEPSASANRRRSPGAALLEGTLTPTTAWAIRHPETGAVFGWHADPDRLALLYWESLAADDRCELVAAAVAALDKASHRRAWTSAG